jgi:hypothetical protein
MAGYDISVGKKLLPRLLSGQKGPAKLVEAVFNQILETEPNWGQALRFPHESIYTKLLFDSIGSLMS